MDLTYRSAVPADLDILLGFEARYMQEIEPERYSAWLATEEQQLQALKDNREHMFVAVTGRRLLGHCFWSFVASIPTICSLYVLPEWRHQGVGRKLLVCAERDIQHWNGERVQLHTRVNNPAQAMYEAVGYELTDRDGLWLTYNKALPD